MATEFHLTPQGPRRCKVDSSNPNSRGCLYGGIHFDHFDDAMEVYSENLKEQFGEFSVLMRPSLSEKARRIGYRSLETVDKIAASPQVALAVSSLKTVTKKAKEAYAEIKESKRELLPATVKVIPLEESFSEEENAEEVAESQTVFDPSLAELDPIPDLKPSSVEKDYFSNLPESDVDRAIRLRAEALEEFRTNRKNRTPVAKDHKAKILRYAKRVGKRSVKPLMVAGVKLKSIGNEVVTPLANGVKKARLQANHLESKTLEAAGIYKDKVIQKSTDTVSAAKKRAARMAIPASHIRAGDTFDGARVKSVESLEDGKLKIRYMVASNGPVLSTTVDSDRKMAVDRKTRREARNSRISSSVKTRVASTKALSSRVSKATAGQFKQTFSLLRKEPRFGSIDKSIAIAEKQKARVARQRELVAKLGSLRKSSQLEKVS